LLNFELLGVLETVRSLINAQHTAVPPWLRDVFLGTGVGRKEPAAEREIDFGDTFLDANHVREAFAGKQLEFDGRPPPYAVTVSPDGSRVKVRAYTRPDMGPFPEDEPLKNKIRFTPRQVESIGSGVQPGLTLVVGPPGTGKTDVTVQIVCTIHRQNPDERILLLTHSNAALNQLFEKLSQLDFEPTRLVRMGHGEKDLQLAGDYSPNGRVDELLRVRLTALQQVGQIAASMGMSTDAAYSCET
jgi:intron-binding protein aquarius